MAHPTLSQVQGLESLQRSYKWNISFLISGSTDATSGSALEEAFTTGVTGDDLQLSDADLQTLLGKVNIRCMSSTVPKPSNIEEVVASPHGVTIVEPGIIDLSGEITFTIVETTDLIARKILYALQQICMTDESKVQKDIHGTGSLNIIAKLRRLDNQNNENLLYTCQRCFISGMTDPEFTSTSGAVTPTFTLTYNYFTIDFKSDKTTRNKPA